MHLGQGGIQLGSCIWEQYCKEHGITMNGVRRSKLYKQMERVRKDDNNAYEAVPLEEQTDEKIDPHHAVVEESSVFFTHNHANDTHSPRAVFVDLEPNVIDDLQYSAFGQLFNPAFLINNKEDAANNYARGRYTIGKEVEDLVQEAVRKNVEACSSLQAFIFSQTVAGGTGSGKYCLFQWCFLFFIFVSKKMTKYDTKNRFWRHIVRALISTIQESSKNFICNLSIRIFIKFMC